MNIRFMCLGHYCDLNIEGDELEIRKLQGSERYMVSTSVLVANSDGTYEFDFSNCYCPEFDSLYNQEAEKHRDKNFDASDEAASMDVWCDDNTCQNTWTAVMYNNFTQIGGRDVPAPSATAESVTQ